MQKNNKGNPSEDQSLNFGQKAIIFPALIPLSSSPAASVPGEEKPSSPAEKEAMPSPPTDGKGRGEDKPISFLFSVRQVEDIIKEVLVYPVPFSPPYIEGITEWRDHVVPVISLEKCMGFEIRNRKYETENTRLIMVRIPSPEEGVPPSTFTGGDTQVSNPESRIPKWGGEKRIMFRVSPSIRMVPFPIPCTPLSSAQKRKVKIQNLELVRGIYEWEEGYLVVAHTVSILFGVH